MKNEIPKLYGDTNHAEVITSNDLQAVEKKQKELVAILEEKYPENLELKFLIKDLDLNIRKLPAGLSTSSVYYFEDTINNLMTLENLLKKFKTLDEKYFKGSGMRLGDLFRKYENLEKQSNELINRFDFFLRNFKYNQMQSLKNFLKYVENVKNDPNSKDRLETLSNNLVKFHHDMSLEGLYDEMQKLINDSEELAVKKDPTLQKKKFDVRENPQVFFEVLDRLKEQKEVNSLGKVIEEMSPALRDTANEANLIKKEFDALTDKYGMSIKTRSGNLEIFKESLKIKAVGGVDMSMDVKSFENPEKWNNGTKRPIKVGGGQKFSRQSKKMKPSVG